MTFTLIHVLLSLVGIFAGLVVAGAMVSGRRLEPWNGIFLTTTVLTNVTGFFFPFVALLPSHIVGVVSLVILPVTIAAFYWKRLEDGWRTIYVVGAVAALHLNVFVLLAQLFRRLPALIAAAPTQKEAPFVVSQGLVLALFVWLGVAALRGFRAGAISRLRQPEQLHGSPRDRRVRASRNAASTRAATVRSSPYFRVTAAVFSVLTVNDLRARIPGA